MRMLSDRDHCRVYTCARILRLEAFIIIVGTMFGIERSIYDNNNFMITRITGTGKMQT